MADKNSVKEKIKKLISIEDLHDYIDKEFASIVELENFRILKDNILFEFCRQRTNDKYMFFILISEDNLKNLSLENIKDVINRKLANELRETKNIIKVDGNFEILSSEHTGFRLQDEIIEKFTNDSKKGFCVFYCCKEGISYFVKGKYKINAKFWTYAERIRYYEKKDVSRINEVFDIYRNQHLPVQDVYSKFFLDKADLKSVFGEKEYEKHKNTLKNRPERYFKGDLVGFLKRELIYDIQSREMELATKQKVDIFFETEGKFYFFEVKWVGKSVKESKDKNDLYKSRVDKAIKGVEQTLGYIRVLIEKMDYDVGCGYLLVYDARDINEPIDYKDRSEITEELRAYYDQHFTKIDELIVENIHP